MRLVRDGLTNKQVASRLHYSPKTVEVIYRACMRRRTARRGWSWCACSTAGWSCGRARQAAGYWGRMTQENVNFLRALFDGAGSLDRKGMLDALPEVIAQTCDPEIEWVEDPQRADGRVYRGHDGVRESWERWLQDFEEYGFDVEELIDCGDKVLVVAREHGRGSASGADVSSLLYSVVSFRDGRIIRYQEFYDEHAARAAGLD
jgi:ketosteroid isomerase-like protein